MPRIAFLDSGIGGLTVLREVARKLPRAELWYLADQAHCPYGRQPPEALRGRIVELSRQLSEVAQADLLVLACNTACGVALEDVRRAIDIPVVGMEPAVKPASELTDRKKIAVLATGSTLRSSRFERLVRQYASDSSIIQVECTEWVELVESGTFDGPPTRESVARVIQPLLDQGVDVIVLGCTHFPVLKPIIEELVSDSVAVIDTAIPVARQVLNVLGRSADRPGTGAGLEAPTLRFYSTDAAVLRKDVVAAMVRQDVDFQDWPCKDSRESLVRR